MKRWMSPFHLLAVFLLQYASSLLACGANPRCLAALRPIKWNLATLVAFYNAVKQVGISFSLGIADPAKI